MRHDVNVASAGERLSAWHFPARSEALEGSAGRPCIVMAHGFAATRDSGLSPYAERFAQAGADVLCFDYRGFADSTGTPRQCVDHRRHRQDYHAAVAHARALEGIDPDRIVLWGSSYSGGHVVAVAAQDPRIAGVIAQGAAMDGLQALLEVRRYAGLGQLLRLTGAGLADVVGRALGRHDRMIPVVGPPGTLAAITSADGEPGYSSITGPAFRNELPARCTLLIPLNRPVRFAPKVRVPVFLVVATHDTIAPPAAVRQVARRVRGRVESLELPVGHFDIYTGEEFETGVAAQVAFVEGLQSV